MNNNILIPLIDEIIITIKSVLSDYKSDESCKEFKRLEEINIDAYKLMQDIKKINNETNGKCDKFENENLFLRKENEQLQELIDNQNKEIYILEGTREDYLSEINMIKKECEKWEQKYNSQKEENNNLQERLNYNEEKYKDSLSQLKVIKHDYSLLEDLYNELINKFEDKYSKLNNDYNTLKEEYDELCDLYRVTLVRQYKKELPERKHNNSPILKIQNPWHMLDADSLHKT